MLLSSRPERVVIAVVRVDTQTTGAFFQSRSHEVARGLEPLAVAVSPPMTPFFVPFHVTPHTEVLPTSFMLAFVRLFARV